MRLCHHCLSHGMTHHRHSRTGSDIFGHQKGDQELPKFSVQRAKENIKHNLILLNDSDF